jgi:outer membrane receptor protein involved in Fe transport
VQGQENTTVTDLGYVIQEDLNFDDKIIASLGVRFDRSTLNNDQSKFYAFPKASLAANLHNLGIVQGDLLNRLKLRVAYGETGGLPNFGETYESLVPQLIGGRLGGQVSTRGVDPNLVPETAKEIELGIDAGFFNDKVSLEATYYVKNVNNLIFNQVPPESTGITAIATNAGDLQNKGVELSLGIKAVESDNFRYFTNFIFSKNVSKLTRWDVAPQTVGGFGASLGTYLFAEGYSPTTIVGLPTGTTDPLGFTIYGDRQPDFSLASYNEFNIVKNVDLTFLLHWQKGGSAINLSALLWDDGGTTPNWDGDDDGDGTPNGNDRLLAWAVDGNTGVYIEETSYLKMREMGLYYTLPQSIVGSKFDRIRVGVSANNLLLWTNYGSYDPEVSNFGTQSITGNIEVTPYPSSRRLFFHVKADF